VLARMCTLRQSANGAGEIAVEPRALDSAVAFHEATVSERDAGLRLPRGSTGARATPRTIAHRPSCCCLDRRWERADVLLPLSEGQRKTSPSRRW